MSCLSTDNGTILAFHLHRPLGAETTAFAPGVEEVPCLSAATAPLSLRQLNDGPDGTTVRPMHPTRPASGEPTRDAPAPSLRAGVRVGQVPTPSRLGSPGYD